MWPPPSSQTQPPPGAVTLEVSVHCGAWRWGVVSSLIYCPKAISSPADRLTRLHGLSMSPLGAVSTRGFVGWWGVGDEVDEFLMHHEAPPFEAPPFEAPPFEGLALLVSFPLVAVPAPQRLGSIPATAPLRHRLQKRIQTPKKLCSQFNIRRHFAVYFPHRNELPQRRMHRLELVAGSKWS